MARPKGQLAQIADELGCSKVHLIDIIKENPDLGIVLVANKETVLTQNQVSGLVQLFQQRRSEPVSIVSDRKQNEFLSLNKENISSNNINDNENDLTKRIQELERELAEERAENRILETKIAGQNALIEEIRISREEKQKRLEASEEEKKANKEAAEKAKAELDSALKLKEAAERDRDEVLRLKENEIKQAVTDAEHEAHKKFNKLSLFDRLFKKWE